MKNLKYFIFPPCALSTKKHTEKYTSFIACLEVHRNTDADRGGFRRHDAAIGEGFDSGRCHFAQKVPVTGVDGVGRGESHRFTALDEKEDHRPIARVACPRQFTQMLLAPFGHGIRERGNVRRGAEGDVLDLDEDCLPAPLQEEIDAAVTIRNLGADAIVTKFGDGTAAQPFFDDPIRPQGVGIDPGAVDFDEFKSPGEFTQRVSSSGDEDAVTGDRALKHAAGIGGMGGDDAAIVEFDFGKKSLITTDKTTGMERGGKLHAQISAISRSEMPRR